MKFYEHNNRSIIKTVTYEFLKLISGSSIVFFYTRRLDLTFSIAIISIITGMILYYLHERVWNKIHWSKE